MLATRQEGLHEERQTARSSFELRCPRCYYALGLLGPGSAPFVCGRCQVKIDCEMGIWKALLPEREAHFQRFLEDYEFIRAQEGRGSEQARYYVALPHRDLSGRNRRQWAIRACTFRYLESKLLPRVGPRQNARLRILDLGAGNGWMSYRLARQGHAVVAVDLTTNQQDGLGAAKHYAAYLPALFPCVQADLDNLPFTSHQFDLAIFNASFHYSECYERTLAEALRCVRPGGTVLIADTAWYPNEESGQQMLAERRASFTRRYGFASDEISSLEYLTGERLRDMAEALGISWQVHTPRYGLRWALRPWVAKVRGRRLPSQFRIFATTVPQ